MKRNIIILGVLSLLFTGCLNVENVGPDDSQDGIYKKAVVKLVKEQNKTYAVDKNIINYVEEK